MFELPVRPTRVMVNPQICWSRSQLDGMVEQIVVAEAAIREASNAPPMTAPEMSQLRNMVIYRINAETIPAGNA